jgi:FtsZ-binding cell division protein ZapB
MFVKIPLAFRILNYLKELVKPRQEIISLPPVTVEVKKEKNINDIFHSTNQHIWVPSCYENIMVYCNELAILQRELNSKNKIPLVYIQPNMYQASEWFVNQGALKPPKSSYDLFVYRINLLQAEVERAKDELEANQNFTRSRSIAHCEYILSNANEILKELDGVRTPE